MPPIHVDLRILTTGICAATAGLGTLIYALENSVNVEAAEFICHPYKFPWSHRRPYQALDMSSVRRGYEVYKQVCSACHSLKYLRWRHFINNFMTSEEAKAEAAEALINDFDDKGQPIKRPGIPNDYLPSPYPNREAAAAANSGAAPPDLSLAVWATHGGEDYIFSLLTSYFDPPEGISIDEGKAYNPYFLGGVIAMPQQLFDEGIEYEDGTPATISQQAKDVATFLRFAGEPHHNTRKIWGFKLMVFTVILSFVLVYAKRRMFTIVKSQKFIYRTMKGREWTESSSASPPNPADKERNPRNIKTD